jgi:riboflavin biosynthesis pyrimidine reductase
MEFAIPHGNNKPFIFSCFALSVDGKLCYPDVTSGFAIAKCNYLASQAERDADWWSLSLGRAISDAVIIGGNSIINEHGNYQAIIDIDELCELRKQLNKSLQLLHVIISRDSHKINWADEIIAKSTTIPVLIFIQKLPENLPQYFMVNHAYNPNDIKQVVIDENHDLERLIYQLYQHGITIILNESPYSHHYLQERQLLDEAWLNTSATYIGGQVASLGSHNHAFNAKQHPHYTILTLHSIGYNFIYTRYKIMY